MNYQNELAAYNAQGPSFGEQLLGLGGQVAGAMLMGRPDSIAGRAGNAVLEGCSVANKAFMSNPTYLGGTHGGAAIPE